MDNPLTEEDRRNLPTASIDQTTDAPPEIEQDEPPQAARDADAMMRMIVGTLSPDPDEIQRGLDKIQGQQSPSSGKEVNMRLVVLAVALVFLMFAFDIVFLKM